MPELLTIGETARRSGVAASALRFYEEKGLIASERAGSGHRRYPRPVLRRIAFIVFAQRVGLSLEEIGTELDKLPPHQAPRRRDWSRLSATWTARIDERIAELERLKAGLTECLAEPGRQPTADGLQALGLVQGDCEAMGGSRNKQILIRHVRVLISHTISA